MLDVTSGLLLGSASGTRNLKATPSPGRVSLGSASAASRIVPIAGLVVLWTWM